MESNRTAQQLMAQSIHENRTVGAEYSEALADELLSECDEDCDTSDVQVGTTADGRPIMGVRYWGTTEYGAPWSVKLVFGDEVHCECGAITGERCQWSGALAGTVLVEWMPEYLRASHEAAGSCQVRHCGQWPLNGAERLRLERSCAELLSDSWLEILTA